MNDCAPPKPESAPASPDVLQGGVLRRYLLAAAGIICVALGWIGTFVPGLPTVGFLIIASYCFTRSCPWLEQKLIRNRWFARFLHYLDGDLEMPLKARLTALAMMWTSIAISVTVLLLAGRRNPWVIGAIVFAGLFGSIAIWRFRRKTPADRQAPRTSTAETSSTATAIARGGTGSKPPAVCPASYGRQPPAGIQQSGQAAKIQ